MKTDEIDEILLQTLDDERISRGEKKVLTALFAEHRDHPDRITFFRHRAFEIAGREAGSPQARRVIAWLEDVVKALDAAVRDRAVDSLAEAHFSPGDHCRRRIVSLINQTRKVADICVFTITDDSIAKALVDAHHRGVQVRIVSDDQKVEDRGSDIIDLLRSGIPVRVDNSEHHMHHKFALFDELYLVTGSYNWTRSAATFNEENIVVSSDTRLISEFKKTFNSLWARFAPHSRS